MIFSWNKDEENNKMKYRRSVKSRKSSRAKSLKVSRSKQKILVLCANEESVREETWKQLWNPMGRAYTVYSIGRDLEEKWPTQTRGDIDENFGKFPDGFFEVIINEYCPFSIFKEVDYVDWIERKLKKGGVYVQIKYQVMLKMTEEMKSNNRFDWRETSDTIVFIKK